MGMIAELDASSAFTNSLHAMTDRARYLKVFLILPVKKKPM